MNQRRAVPILLAVLLVVTPLLASSHAVPTRGAALTAPSAADSAVAQKQKQKPKDNGDLTVYVTKTGAKYHAAGCSSLRKSAIPMKLRDAHLSYGPCKNCRPPVYQVYE